MVGKKIKELQIIDILKVWVVFKLLIIDTTIMVTSIALTIVSIIPKDFIFNLNSLLGFICYIFTL